MNYFYDIILNWNEEIFYDFYEWNDNDPLELIKKIPLFRVKPKVLNDLMTNKVMVNEEFLKQIKDKTLTGDKSIVNKIPYAALITDNKSAIALEFNDEGLSIMGSKLLLDDDLNVLEVAYNLREYPLEYKIIEEKHIDSGLRQEIEAKKIINLEIDNLYQNKDIAKLKYLYYEYKREELDNISSIYNDLKDALAKDFDGDILKLYYIIKLSYHKV
ncbi:MAG: DUF3603 family protein [Ruminococcus sp.]|nr:DUF3603 family protein [Ruminococcus sp.]